MSIEQRPHDSCGYLHVYFTMVFPVNTIYRQEYLSMERGSGVLQKLSKNLSV